MPWADRYREIDGKLDSLAQKVEAINSRYIITALGKLKQCEHERKQTDKDTAVLDFELTAEVQNTPLFVYVQTAIHSATGTGIGIEQAQEFVRALASMNRGILSILRIQQKSQSIGAVIERKYAYLFGWFTFYVAILINLGLGLYPVWHDWRSEGVEHDPHEVTGPLAPNVPPKLAIFPIRFPLNAKGESDQWTAGIKLGEPEVRSLGFLIRSLRGCSDIAGQTLIRLRVVGFASSAEFRIRGRSIADSSRLNLEAANRRASEVASLLETLRDKNGLTAHVAIETHWWKTFEEMASHRIFNDHPINSADQRDQEVFNRVVEIEMTDAGACELRTRREK